MAWLCARGTQDDCALFANAAHDAQLSLTRRQMLDILHSVHGLFVVAYASGRPAGFVLAHQLLGTCEIYDLLVLGRYRRQGCGEALLRHVVTHEVARPGRVLVEVADDNAAARLLYAKTQFTPVGLRKDYYARPHLKDPAATVDAHVLERLCP